MGEEVTEEETAARGEKRQLSRANPTDSRNTIPPLVGGLRMVCSHDRNQPGRRRAKSERKRGSPALADTEWNRDRLKCSSDDDNGGGGGGEGENDGDDSLPAILPAVSFARELFVLGCRYSGSRDSCGGSSRW